MYELDRRYIKRMLTDGELETLHHLYPFYTVKQSLIVTSVKVAFSGVYDPSSMIQVTVLTLIGM